ncbi:hypothetical protein HG531_013836 [Fusarium graminearum]|nr:hypothetical protein HG531_013836 [Fusarium graminearum]
MLPVSLSCLGTLKLQSARVIMSKYAVVDSEGVNIEVDIAHLLKAVEFVLLANTVENLEKLGLHLGVVGCNAQICNLVGGDGLLQDLASEWGKVLHVDAENRDQRRLSAVTVNKSRVDEAGATHVNILDTLRGDVLALGELEDVLLAIDDLEAAHLVHLTDVTAVEPTIGIQSLAGLLIVLVILAENNRTANEKLTTRAEFHTAHGTANVSSSEVASGLDGANSVCLGHAKALGEVVGEGGAQELLNIGIKLSAATDHTVNPVHTHSGLDLGSPDSSHVGFLGIDNTSGESATDTIGFNSSGANGRIETVEESGNRDETSGLEDLHIVNQTQDIASEETNRSTLSDSNLINESAVNVGKRQVRHVNILGAHVAVGSATCDSRNGVPVGDHNTLGVTSSTRGVVDGADILAGRRLRRTSRLGANLLNLSHGKDLNPMMRSNLVEDRGFGVRSQLTLLKGVKRHDEFQTWKSRRHLKKNRDMRKRADDTGDLGMVDDTDTVLLGRIANTLVDLNKTSAKVLPSDVEIGVGDPVVLVLPLLSRLVPMTGSETFGIGPLARTPVQDVVCRVDTRLEGSDKRAIADCPVPGRPGGGTVKSFLFWIS